MREQRTEREQERFARNRLGKRVEEEGVLRCDVVRLYAWLASGGG